MINVYLLASCHIAKNNVLDKMSKTEIYGSISVNLMGIDPPALNFFKWGSFQYIMLHNFLNPKTVCRQENVFFPSLPSFIQTK